MGFFSLQPDRYSLRIPEDAAGGLYWPVVGLYDFATVDLLPVQDASGQTLGDTYRLPPIKVINTQPPSPSPQNEVAAKDGRPGNSPGVRPELPKDGLSRQRFHCHPQLPGRLDHRAGSHPVRAIVQALISEWLPSRTRHRRMEQIPRGRGRPAKLLWMSEPCGCVMMRSRDSINCWLALYDPADGSWRFEVRDLGNNPTRRTGQTDSSTCRPLKRSTGFMALVDAKTGR